VRRPTIPDTPNCERWKVISDRSPGWGKRDVAACVEQGEDVFYNSSSIRTELILAIIFCWLRKNTPATTTTLYSCRNCQGEKMQIRSTLEFIDAVASTIARAIGITLY
jgi:hypothetical protein